MSTVPDKIVDIRDHSGSKYIRVIESCIPGEPAARVDVYAVLVAFGVTNPAIAHAIKKLLCAGIRGKGDTRCDLIEAIDSIRRAINMLPPAEERMLQLQREEKEAKDNERRKQFAIKANQKKRGQR